MRPLAASILLSLVLVPFASGQDATDQDLAAWVGGLDRKGIALVHANRLALCGTRSTPFLVGALERGPEEAKKRALWVLLRTLDPVTLPTLHAMVRRGDQVELVCRVLARLGDESSVPVLVERLAADPAGGEPVVSALGAFDVEAAALVLRRTMEESPGLAMRAALGILVHHPDDETAGRRLTDLARSPDARERLRAIWAMGRTRDERFLAPVEEGLKGDVALRRIAIEALGEIGGENSERLLRAMIGATPTDRRRISRALWRATGRVEDLGIWLERYTDQFAEEVADKAAYDERIAAIAEMSDAPVDHAAAGVAPFLGAGSPSLGETVEALRVLDARDDLTGRFLAELSALLGSQDLNVKAYAWMLAERSTRAFFEWPSSFEQTWIEDARTPGSRDQLTLGVAARPRVRRTGAKFLPGLSEGVGILLVAPAPESLRITSEHTFFAIDVAFLDGEGRILSTATLDPGSDAVAIAPQPVRYAILVRKGYLAEKDFGPGDRLGLTPGILNVKAE